MEPLSVVALIRCANLLRLYSSVDIVTLSLIRPLLLEATHQVNVLRVSKSADVLGFSISLKLYKNKRLSDVTIYA